MGQTTIVALSSILVDALALVGCGGGDGHNAPVPTSSLDAGTTAPDAGPWIPPPCTPPATNDCTSHACFHSNLVTADGAGSATQYVQICYSTQESGASRLTTYGIHASGSGGDIWLTQPAGAYDDDAGVCAGAWVGHTARLRFPAVTVSPDPTSSGDLSHGGFRGTFCGGYQSGSDVRELSGSFDITGMTSSSACL